MPTLKALIFDVDGTLADTEETHRVAFNAAFAEFGLDWDWSRAQYAQLLAISGGRERMQAYAESLGGRFERPDNLPEFIRSMHRYKTARYAEMLREGRIRLRPGVLRLITEARAEGLRLAIATSSAYSNVKTLLDANLPDGWAGWFDVIAACDDVETKKPSPAVYNYALLKLGLEAEDCIALEDTPNGCRAAAAAGLTTVITTHYLTEGHDFRDADLVVDQLGEPDTPCVTRRSTLGKVRVVDVPVLRALLDAHSAGLRERRIKKPVARIAAA